MEALWPEAAPGAATHRLQVAASNVRQSLTRAGLADGTLQRHGDAYRLTVADAVLDVGEFESLVRKAVSAEAAGDLDSALRHLSAALSLYVGDLLEEVGPCEWVLAERDRLQLACAATAAAAARIHLSRGEHADALSVARRAVALEPMRDSTWALLSEIQESMGDSFAAEATRRQYRLMCDDLTHS